MEQYCSLRYKRLFLLFLAVCLVSIGFSQSLYTVETLPNPKERGQDFFVSNPDRVLSAATVSQLNQLSIAIEKASGAEYAVVVVDNFEGYDVFEFALQLFNTWGIGKKEENNGLLLFVAKNRREYRFISGYGMEAIFPDAYLHRIGEKHLVPHFRSSNYDSGVLEASQAIHQALMSPDVQAELHRMMPEATPFFSFRNTYLQNSILVILLYAGMYYWVGRAGDKWTNSISGGRKRKRTKKGQKGCRGWFVYVALSGFLTMFTMLFAILIAVFFTGNTQGIFQWAALPYVFAIWGCYTLAFKISEELDIVKKSYRDEENKLKALRRYQWSTFIPYLLSPFMLFGFFSLRRKWKNNHARFLPPDDSGNWERVDRDVVNKRALADYLSKGQLKEERLQSRFYEVWLNKKTGERKILGWQGTKSFSVCPSCGFETYKRGKRGKILKSATYRASGLQEVYDECNHCKHREDKGTRVIPKKVRNTGSGGSGGGRGFSGGSSGGGSFGGGRSGGGGAGGRW